jgi:hypothetical protein
VGTCISIEEVCSTAHLKKVFAIILFIWGGSACYMQITKAGGDSSKIAAAVGVCLIPIILGVLLLKKK